MGRLHYLYAAYTHTHLVLRYFAATDLSGLGLFIIIGILFAVTATQTRPAHTPFSLVAAVRCITEDARVFLVRLPLDFIDVPHPHFSACATVRHCRCIIHSFTQVDGSTDNSTAKYLYVPWYRINLCGIHEFMARHECEHWGRSLAAYVRRTYATTSSTRRPLHTCHLLVMFHRWLAARAPCKMAGGGV